MPGGVRADSGDAANGLAPPKLGFQLPRLQTIVDLRNRQAVSAEEAKCRIVLDHPVATLVQQPMVVTTNADEVIKARFAAIRT